MTTRSRGYYELEQLRVAARQAYARDRRAARRRRTLINASKIVIAALVITFACASLLGACYLLATAVAP